MATITKQKLSASTNGRGIKIAATATAGTALHTAHATALDEVTLYACNTSAVDVVLTIEWGGVTSVDDHIKMTIPAGETVLVVPGLIVTGSVAVAAFAGTTNVISVFGFVNRIS